MNELVSGRMNEWHIPLPRTRGTAQERPHLGSEGHRLLLFPLRAWFRGPRAEWTLPKGWGSPGAAP